MEDRLGLLEARVGELAESIRGLQARLNNLERAESSALGDFDAEPLFGRHPTRDRGSLDSALPLLGKAVLILGGAFLVRMLTDASTLSPRVGVFLGLVYAGIWLALADRAGRRGRRLAAVVLATAGMLVACPLLWEATTRFHALDATGASVLLTVLAGFGLAMAVRHRVPAVAWMSTLLPAATAVGLLGSSPAVVPTTAFLIALGFTTDRLAESPIGSGLRWPAAAAADLAVLVMIAVTARPGGPVGPYRGLSLSTAQTLTLLLPAAYLASFAVRILVSRRSPGLFEALQSLFVILLGAAGARWLGGTAISNTALVVSVGAVGLGAYAAALMTSQGSPRGRFGYFSSVAILLLVIFSGICLPPGFAALLWCSLALATAGGSSRRRRPDLAIHAAVYMALAALASGLGVWVVRAFTADPLPFVGALLEPLLVGFCAGGVSALLAVSPRASARDRRVRISAAFSGFFALLAAASAVILLASRAIGWGANPVALSALRSGVLAVATIGLAAAAGRWKREEIAWVAWALLVAGALKILVQDVPSGRAAILALSFAFYGAALTVAPGFLKRAVARTS